MPVAGEDWTDCDISMRVRFTGTSAPLGKLVDLFNRTEDRGLNRDADGSLFQELPPFSPASARRGADYPLRAQPRVTLRLALDQRRAPVVAGRP